MEQASARGRRPLHLLIVAIALATVALAALTPGVARAQAFYIHGGIPARDCGTCHLNGHTESPPTNEVCLDCHPEFQVTRPGLLCWTCHSPGQDMSASRTDAACVSACHLPGGSSSTHAAHPDRPATCTGCHPVTASPADRAGSAHHFVPAPALAVVAPAAGLPGATVTLTGSHLRGAAAVSFNGVWALFHVDSDAQITAVVPPRATSGLVSVITPGGQASSLQDFVVTVTPSLTVSVRPAVSRVNRRVRIGGLLSPTSLSGAKVALTVQLRRSGAWKTVSTALRATNATGAYAWEYPPARRGAYRARAAIAETPANVAAQTAWRSFRVD